MASGYNNKHCEYIWKLLPLILSSVSSTLQIALCYFDLKDALVLDPDHAEACQIMSEFRQEADRCHTSAVQLALQKRHRDALHKISMAIEYDPTHAEFHNIRCDD